MAAYLQRLRAKNALQGLLAERSGTKQKIVIDYSSPNIAKQFHIGNLRSTLIGAYLDRVNRALGHDVISVNYLGDWGRQFALIAAYWPQVRPSESYWNSLNDVEKLRSLTDCYVVANKKIEDDKQFEDLVKKTYLNMETNILRKDFSSEAMKLWMDIRSISENHLKRFYTLLNIRFDRWLCESDLVARAHKEVDKLTSEEKLRKTTDGLMVLDHSAINENNIYSILKKSDNCSLYLTREIASILERDELFGADRYLYVVDKAQEQHFLALQKVLDRMGMSDLAGKIEHVPFGRVIGLSTRRGRTEAIEEIIKNGTEQALEFIKASKTIKVPSGEINEIAEQLSVSTIIYNEMKRARCSNYEFSFKNAFNLEQHNGLSFQVRHSRLFSIETRNSDLLNHLADCQTVPEDNQDVLRLLEHLNLFGETIDASAASLEPCQLSFYLAQLSRYIGPVVRNLKVQKQPKEVAVPRLLLISASRNAIAEGMRLLGITPVNRM